MNNQLSLFEGACVNETSLNLRTDNPAIIEEIGQKLALTGSALWWWVGDFLLQSNITISDFVSKFDCPLEPLSVRHAVRVAKIFPANMRNKYVSWAGHYYVSSGELSNDDRIMLLEMAEKEGWSAKRLRAEKNRLIARRKFAESPRVFSKDWEIITGDAFEPGILPVEHFDAIVTDPPYGAKNADLYQKLARLAEVTLKPGGTAFVMTGHAGLDRIMDAINGSGSGEFKYQWMVAYLLPGKNAHVSRPFPINAGWKPIMVYSRGTPNFNPEFANDVISNEILDADVHPNGWGQGVDGFRKLSRMACPKGGIILDPFAGTGTTAVAAVTEGRRVVGVEIDPENAAVARGRFE